MNCLKCVAMGLALLVIAACGDTSAERDIGRADRQIPDDPAQTSADTARLAELAASAPDAPRFEAGRSYDLPALIDLAQSRNPATREAWLAAREAGRQSGIVGSALLPVITAAAVAGRQSTNTSLPLPLIGDVPGSVETSGEAVALTATWLLYDFGENAARQRAATSLSRVSEIAFNTVHRQLIFDVSAAYHSRLAALKKVAASREARTRSADLVRAAERRFEQGSGTTVEVAQARQLDAQTRLVEEAANGEARAAAVNLAALINVPPSTGIRLKPPGAGLPSATDKTLERVLDQAFARRSDVRAALAQVDAAQASLDATVASYRPKVFSGGYTSAGDGRVDLNGLAPIGLNTAGSSGLFIGVSVPIVDGGLREKRLAAARDRLERSRAGVEVARLSATREIALSYETLRTALALYPATRALTDAARTTADAAKEAYSGGIGTISDAGVAELGLYAAKEALADAERDARVAAAALALATGN
ncbi:outer membrane protein TolC [Aliiruegeria haliotis]|uniref:Protein CyaE n=1 Tax=Aliiruegeria haliotis TaxID=1280846 RepID=A0A2T0RH60_9RHOB|nr:TolC family protein [Aliiruegeria haliotis]PRY20477.1 outer membrane protein TolC [Aliiruegeria haliotis]